MPQSIWQNRETWIWDFDTLTYERSKLTGFVNVPVMPQSMGKIVRLGFGILIPSTTKGLKSLGVIYWYTNNKMCHRHDDFRSRTSFQYVSHTWRAWRYVNCFDRSRCGSWLSMTFGPTSSIPESSNRTENFAQVVGLRAVHVLNRLIDAVQISTL